MMWLPDGENIVKMFTRFDRIHVVWPWNAKLRRSFEGDSDYC